MNSPNALVKFPHFVRMTVDELLGLITIVVKQSWCETAACDELEWGDSIDVKSTGPKIVLVFAKE